MNGRSAYSSTRWIRALRCLHPAIWAFVLLFSAFGKALGAAPIPVTFRVDPRTTNLTYSPGKQQGPSLSANHAEADYSVSGTLTAVSPGNYSFTVTATGSYSGNQTFSWRIGKRESPASWQSIAPITYNTALTSDQLNATSDIPGAFTYSPRAGTFLSVGDDQPLTAIFTPVDSVNFSPITLRNTISVNPADQAQMTLLASSESVPVGSKVEFTAVGGSGRGDYVWSPPAGRYLTAGSGPTATADFSIPGKFTVTVYRRGDTNHTGDSNTASSTVTVFDPPRTGTTTGPTDTTH
jgi:hypothetical protein